MPRSVTQNSSGGALHSSRSRRVGRDSVFAVRRELPIPNFLYRGTHVATPETLSSEPG
jgi:hypothetical protein